MEAGYATSLPWPIGQVGACPNGGCAGAAARV